MNKHLSCACRNVMHKHPLVIALMAIGLSCGLPLSAHADMMSHDGKDGLPVHGFTDVDFNLNNNGKYDAKGFSLNAFDLYFTPQSGDRIKGLVELNFEAEQGNGLGSGGIATDLERLQVGYVLNDSATFWAGRMHTPYGYWNTGFHHGANIQTSLLRPKFIDFEDKGGIMPSHLTGAWLTGKISAGESKVNYDLYVGNGPRTDIDPASPTPNAGVNQPTAGGDSNHQGFVGFNLAYNLTGAADGLIVGVNGFQGGVDDTLADRTDVQMAGLWGVYMADDWEIMSEYYHFNDTNKFETTPVLPNGTTLSIGNKNTSDAWFLQVGKAFGPWTPYARVEKASLSPNDAYFAHQITGASYNRQAVGVRYDLTTTSAVKVELFNTKYTSTNADGLNADGSTLVAGDKFSEMRVQWSIRF